MARRLPSADRLRAGPASCAGRGRGSCRWPPARRGADIWRWPGRRGAGIRSRQVLAILAAVLALFTAAEAPALAPLDLNWQEYFRVDWQVAERAGQPLLFGHVRSIGKYGARWMQLLVDRLDPAGAVIDQRLVWLPSEITRGSLVYFEVGVETAASYRVAVFWYEPPPRP